MLELQGFSPSRHPPVTLGTIPLAPPQHRHAGPNQPDQHDACELVHSGRLALDGHLLDFTIRAYAEVDHVALRGAAGSGTLRA